ncbi:MAG: hypothetical protein AB7G75_32095 [Candidatus Binatia bacterium]
MATVDLTLKQLREAIVQLPKSQRQKLLADIARTPTPDEAREKARRVRSTFRMPARQRERLATLLAKGNAGTLTTEENRELDALVDQFEDKTLAMAREISRLRKTS